MSKTKGTLKVKAFVAGLAMIALAAGAIFCYVQRSRPERFSSFFPGPLMACSVSHVGGGTAELKEAQRNELANLLENAELYFEGPSGKLLLGELYHVTLQGPAGNGAPAFLEVIVSDEGFFYMERKKYRLGKDTGPLILLLQAALEGQGSLAAES